MSTGRHILVVSPNSRTVNTLIAWLSPAGYELSVVNSFAAAKHQLNAGLDLLLTDLKLQEHNGLHLALRAKTAGIPAIVLGPHDAVLAKDASELGAAYLSELPARSDFLKLVSDLLISSPRVTDALVAAHATGQGELMWHYVGSRPRVNANVDSQGRRLLLH